MMTETAVDKNRLIAELSKSPHGKLEEYQKVGLQAAREDPEFFSHLISWNERKGSIRDSKVALPMVYLQARSDRGALTVLGEQFVSNALAHLALLNPRDLVRGLRFALAHRPVGFNNAIRKMTARYLMAREANTGWFQRQALQHRLAMQELYALSHTKAGPLAKAALFTKGDTYPKWTVFNTVRNLKDMSPSEAAGHIMEKKISFMVAWRALGVKAKEEATLMALISRMTPTELTTNTKWLVKAGIKTNPVLRAAYEEGLKRAGEKTRGKVQTFKTTVAADSLDEDDPIREKLRGLQEKQIKNLPGIEGNWLVLADKSGSMEVAIEASRVISATLAKMVKGQVHLVFFDTSPRHLDVTGDDYDTIVKKTAAVTAAGGTSIGVGLQYILERGIQVDGIVIVSDGAENQYPQFGAVYEVASQKWGKKVPVYLYLLQGLDHPQHTIVFLANCDRVGATPVKFDLRVGQVDYYSLPNLISTMRVNRYSLLDEIMETPLLDLDVILPKLVVNG